MEDLKDKTDYEVRVLSKIHALGSNGGTTTGREGGTRVKSLFWEGEK